MGRGGENLRKGISIFIFYTNINVWAGAEKTVYACCERVKARRKNAKARRNDGMRFPFFEVAPLEIATHPHKEGDNGSWQPLSLFRVAKIIHWEAKCKCKCCEVLKTDADFKNFGSLPLCLWTLRQEFYLIKRSFCKLHIPIWNQKIAGNCKKKRFCLHQSR